MTAFLGSLGITAAAAGVARSPYGYFSGSYQYVNFAEISTGSGFAQADSYIARSGGGSVPAGYVGARGRLFTSGGSLSCEGATTYNSTTLFGFHDAWSCLRSTSGTWYSYGVTYGYNGSGYNASYTYVSPNQSS